MVGPFVGRLAMHDMKTRPPHGDQPRPANTGWGRPWCRAAAPSLSPERFTQPNASIPRKPLRAGPRFLAGYIEQAGTGTLDMIVLSLDAGLRTPGFRQHGGSFIQAFWRPEVEVTAEVTPQAAQQVAAMLQAASEPRSREALQASMDLRDREHFRGAFLQPRVKAGWIGRSLPDKPTSPHQKCRLTAKRRAWLVKQSKSS